MRMMRSGGWMLAAVIALATTGCGPRSAKEFAGTYEVSSELTSTRFFKSPDTGADVSEKSSNKSTLTMTLEAKDDATLTWRYGEDASAPTLVYKQDPTKDSNFNLEPVNVVMAAGGASTNMKFESGSFSFDPGTLSGSMSGSSSSAYPDANGVTQTETSTFSTYFSGTRK